MSDGFVTGRPNGPELRVVLQEVLVQLGLNVLAVRVLAQGRTVRPENDEKNIKIFLGSATPCASPPPRPSNYSCPPPS
jgi:hypothetical protein